MPFSTAFPRCCQDTARRALAEARSAEVVGQTAVCGEIVQALHLKAEQLLADVFADRFVFIAASVKSNLNFAVQSFIVAQQDVILGIGNRAWFESVQETVFAQFEREEGRAAIYLEESDLLI